MPIANYLFCLSLLSLFCYLESSIFSLKKVFKNKDTQLILLSFFGYTINSLCFNTKQKKLQKQFIQQGKEQEYNFLTKLSHIPFYNLFKIRQDKTALFDKQSFKDIFKNKDNQLKNKLFKLNYVNSQIDILLSLPLIFSVFNLFSDLGKKITIIQNNAYLNSIHKDLFITGISLHIVLNLILKNQINKDYYEKYITQEELKKTAKKYGSEDQETKKRVIEYTKNLTIYNYLKIPLANIYFFLKNNFDKNQQNYRPDKILCLLGQVTLLTSFLCFHNSLTLMNHEFKSILLRSKTLFISVALSQILPTIAMSSILYKTILSIN